MALFSILDELKSSDERVVVLSEKVNYLDIIEYYLAMFDTNRANPIENETTKRFMSKWIPGIDYIRSDETYPTEYNAENSRARFVH